MLRIGRALLLLVRRSVAVALVLLVLPAFAVPPEDPAENAAERITRLSQRAQEVYRDTRELGREEATARVAAALDRVERAIEEAGAPANDLEALAARVDFYAACADMASYSGDDPVADLLRRRSAGYARATLELARAGALTDRLWREHSLWYSTDQFWQYVLALELASDPNDPEAFAGIAERVPDDGLQLALLRTASNHLTAARSARDGHRFEAWLLQERIDRLFGLGLPNEALASLETASAPARALVLSGSWGIVPREPSGQGPPVERHSRDLRLDLAAAYALRGDRETASGLLGQTPPAPARFELKDGAIWDPAARQRASYGLKRDTLSRYLALSGTAPFFADDPFDRFLDLLSVRQRGYEAGPHWRLLEAELAEAVGYPQIAHRLRAGVCRGLYPVLGTSGIERFEPYGGLPALVKDELTAIHRSVEVARLRLQTDLEGDVPRPLWVTPLSCAQWTGSDPPPAPTFIPAGAHLESFGPARRLRPPRRMDGSRKPVAASHLRPDQAGLPLPDGIVPVDVFRRGSKLLVLALPGPDPSSVYGAYVLLRSVDGGGTWERPRPIGIDVRQPLEIVAGSRRARITGDRLVLETRLTHHPHPELPGVDGDDGLLLELPLDPILSDSDGDGLTDLEESAEALTDPESPDTDDDGIGDAFDRLILSAARSEDDDFERILARVIEESTGVRRNRVAAGIPSDNPIPPGWTRLVVGAGMPLSRMRTAERVVVRAAPPESAPFSGFRVTLFVFDRARERVIVEWSEVRGGGAGSSGGIYLLRRAADGSGRWAMRGGQYSDGCVLGSVTPEPLRS